MVGNQPTTWNGSCRRERQFHVVVLSDEDRLTRGVLYRIICKRYIHAVQVAATTPGEKITCSSAHLIFQVAEGLQSLPGEQPACLLSRRDTQDFSGCPETRGEKSGDYFSNRGKRGVSAC